MLIKNKPNSSELILYTGKPLILKDEECSEDIIISSIENKYEDGIITLQSYFKDDEDSITEIELTKEMIQMLYARYCFEKDFIKGSNLMQNLINK